MDKIIINAKTVDEAITKAMLELNTTSDNLEYNIVKENNGFLGLGKTIDVEFWIKGTNLNQNSFRKESSSSNSEVYEFVSKKASSAPNGSTQNLSSKEEFIEGLEKSLADTNSYVYAKDDVYRSNKNHNFKKRDSLPKEPLTRDEEEIKTSILSFLNPIFKSMNINPEISISIDRPERNINVVFVGDKMGLVIGKRGQTLASLQHLLNIVINNGDVQKAKVILDTENYKEKRRDTLERLAKSIATKVKRNKSDISLEPMSSYERRIVHEVLANDPNVETISCGDGLNRFVIIKYKGR